MFRRWCGNKVITVCYLRFFSDSTEQCENCIIYVNFNEENEIFVRVILLLLIKYTHVRIYFYLMLINTKQVDVCTTLLAFLSFFYLVFFF